MRGWTTTLRAGLFECVKELGGFFAPIPAVFAVGEWAERGARSPGAHVLIAMIAAAAHAMKGDSRRAEFWAANVRERNAALTLADFYRAFPMKSDTMRGRVLEALTKFGF